MNRSYSFCKLNVQVYEYVAGGSNEHLNLNWTIFNVPVYKSVSMVTINQVNKWSRAVDGDDESSTIWKCDMINCLSRLILDKKIYYCVSNFSVKLVQVRDNNKSTRRC